MNLDDLKKMQKLDTGNVARSIEQLPDQIKQVVEDSRLINVPREYSKCSNIVFNGMGGSNLGLRIVKSAFADQIKAPVILTPGYSVPNFVGPDTLYIISSYSGTTEEPLSVFKEVRRRKAKILGITMHDKNSRLEKLMMKENIPGYIFAPGYNISGQPRLGVGYTAFGTAALIAKAGMFKIVVREVEDMIASLELWSCLFRPESPLKNNEAKSMAAKLWGRIPILVGAEHLTGNLHAMRNQINECSKQFATYLSIPELNHYAMESLQYPEENKDNLAFLFFDSKFYSPRIQQRIKLTKKVVAKNNIPVFSFVLAGENKMTQAFELLSFGSWMSYYIGILNGVDPVKIPWVDWFKKQLK